MSLVAAFTAWALVTAFVAGFWVGRLPRRRDDLEVAVRQSTDSGKPVKHMVSAQLRTRNGCLHYERVDMREEGWEERLAVAVAEMKHKRRTLEAAKKLVRESVR